MKKRSLILCLLNLSLLFSTVQPLLAVTPAPTISTTPTVPSTTAANIAGAFLETIQNGVITGVGTLSTTIRKFNFGWKNLKKFSPQIATALGGLLILHFLKVPFKNMWKEGVKSIPEKINYRLGAYIPFVRLPFGPTLSVKKEFSLSWLKFLLSELPEKDKRTFKETTPKKDLNALAAKKLNEKLKRYLDMIKAGICIKPIYIHGEPGNGKSLEAEVFANQIGQETGAEIVLLSTSGASFLSKYVGQGAENVRGIFSHAESLADSDSNMIKKFFSLIAGNKKVVILIDELYSIGNGTKGENQHGWPVVEALQVEISRIFPNKNIFLIATGNSTDLPGAVRRRFHGIFFAKHDTKTKIGILLHHLKEEAALKGLKIEENIITEDSYKAALEKLNLQDITEENILSSSMPDIAKEAVFEALQKNAKTITKEDLKKAIQYVVKDEDEKERSMNYGKENEISKLKKILTQPKKAEDRLEELEKKLDEKIKTYRMLLLNKQKHGKPISRLEKKTFSISTRKLIEILWSKGKGLVPANTLEKRKEKNETEEENGSEETIDLEN